MMRAVKIAGLLFALTVLTGADAQQTEGQMVPNIPVVQPAPQQPLPFSHKLHVENEVACELCHVNPDPGNHMTFPATETCMGCHEMVATDKPAIKKLTEMAKTGTTIPWVRVYQVTPGVTWTHRKHLDAGLQCVNCHGDVGKQEQMTQITSVTAMGACLGCHAEMDVSTVCHTCHAWPSRELLGLKSPH